MEPEFGVGILNIVLGGIVLLSGRNIFWLVIGLIGFLLGVEYGRVLLAQQPALLIAIGAIALGILGAVLGIIFERAAFGLAGFFAATFVATVLPVELGYVPLPFLAVLVAGVLGAVIAVLIMDWGIIVLTALMGSAVIVSAVSLAPLVEAMGFTVLALTGIFVQSYVRSRRRAPS